MNRGFSMIGMLVAAAIIIILFILIANYGSNIFGGHTPQRADKQDRTIVSGSKARANDAVCMNNIRQVKAAIEMAKSSEGKPPETLDELKLGRDLTKCPIGGEPYQYDPQTGTVHCPHPGHEKY